MDAFEAKVGHTTAEWLEFLGPKSAPKPAVLQKWTCPPPDFIKLNFDAAFDANSHRGGWGIIARDADGDVEMAASGALNQLGSALQAEAQAFLHAIRLAEQHGMGRVIFETDCLALQQATTSDAADRGPLGVLFRKAKFQLNTGFIDYRIVYSPRACNSPAHVLASLGSKGPIDGQHVWYSDIPVNVICAVTADLVGPN